MALRDYRQSDGQGTADTFASLGSQVSGSEGDPVVPPGVGAITKLIFHGAYDLSGTAGRAIGIYRIRGQALDTRHKPLDFVGEAVEFMESTEGTALAYTQPTEVPVNIPVTPGQSFVLEAKFIGDDVGTHHPSVTVVYDGPSASPQLRAAEVREADLTASDSLVDLDTDVDDNQTTRDYEPPNDVGQLFAVDCAVALAPTNNTNRILHEWQLDGNALNTTQRPQKFAGTHGGVLFNTNGVDADIRSPERYVTQLELDATRGNDLIARASIANTDYGAATAALGALYV